MATGRALEPDAPTVEDQRAEVLLAASKVNGIAGRPNQCC